MRERDERVALEGPVQVDHACWGGPGHGGKGGCGAAGKTLLVAVAEVTRDGRPPELRMSRVKGLRKAALRRRAGRHLKAGTSVECLWT